MKLALILPARDEAACIEAVVTEAGRYFRGDIIVVDNGSKDDTAARAAAAGARVVSEPIPGYGRSCMAGVRAASEADAFVFMDADGSDCPGDIPLLITAIAEGAAIAIGVRTGERVAPGSIAPAARFGNWLSGTLIRFWSGRRIKDLSPLKATTKEALEQINPTEMTYGWTVELLAVAATRRMPIAEVITGYRHRAGGDSKVSGNLSGSFRAGCRILLVLGRVFVKSLSSTTLGAFAGGLTAAALLAVFSVWLFVAAPSSSAVLIGTWLLAWPALLAGVLFGTVAAGVLTKNRARA